ncbi:MAG: M1 family metallopeptidase [Methanoregulaceae archaeon]|nr:M1 family metallopeptidase [Methanoregulaceae archaeon]
MSGPHAETGRLFRYYPKDFGALTVRVIHMDLVFDINDDHTRVSSHLTAEVLDQPITRLALNASDLEILSVSCDIGNVTTEYDRTRNLLILSWDLPLPARTRFTITTETICRPTDHLLEGLYFDRTPAGAPPTQITQCQQWGFQRLVPCIDDMTAKCTYTTTIIADSRYTSIISNGDIARARHPAGNGRDSITYDNSRTPMAPYLFFLCVGTYDTFTREFEYPDGSTFGLELLVPPGSDPVVAAYALQVVADAIMWIFLYTGPGGSYDPEKKKRLLALIRERDLLKERGGNDHDLSELRERIREISSDLTPGYQYTGTVYREIGMQNSDFGGMENVGNTTITMNRIMPYPQMTDPAFEYMIRVKVHEFYHNLNGSEVTGKSPFEIWLNEAVTAFIEEKYHAFLFHDRYTRLQTVLTLFAPSTGIFALDSGSMSMPIEPDGFNDPNDLITGITYVKAAEFVRMIETLMGKEVFDRGLDLYHTRYRHSNATWQQWIEAMEKVSGQEFMEMARTWLKQTGFPVVKVSGRYDVDHRQYVLSLAQSYPEHGSPWTFPFRAALVDAEGNDMAEILKRVSDPEETIIVEGVEQPAFLSLNRDSSFYGKVQDDADARALRLQALKDPDVVNRFIALYRLAERELIRLIENPDDLPSEDFIGLYHRLLTDDSLSEAVGGLHLTLFDAVDDLRYAHRYTALYRARRKIEEAIAARYSAGLKALYHSHDRVTPLTAPLELQASAIRERQMKNTCLSLLATLDNGEIHEMIQAQVKGDGVATDRIRAFSLYLNSTAADRLTILESFEQESAVHPVSWEACLAAVGGCSAQDVVALIRQAESLPSFRITQVNDHRALYGAFAANRKMSLETSQGREFMGEILVRLAQVNQNSTVSLLKAFGAVDLMDPVFFVPLVELLVFVRDALDPEKFPVIQNTIRRLLIGAPGAVEAYERTHGRLVL